MSNTAVKEYDESTGNKTFRKIKENPMVPIGMAGFFAGVVYGVRNFKNRPKHMSASMYIMRFRVFAQSIAVGSMFVGMAYTILKDHWAHRDDPHTEGTKKQQ